MKVVCFCLMASVVLMPSSLLCRRHLIIATVYTDNGSITADPSAWQEREMVLVEDGNDVTFTFTPNCECPAVKLYVDGVETPVSDSTYTFFDVHEDHTISVGFFDSFDGQSYTITTSSGALGTIVPEGEIWVKEGYDAVFRFVPNVGYHFVYVEVDGEQVSYPHSTYEFDSVTSNHSIFVDFDFRFGYEYRTLDDIGLWQHGDTVPDGTISPDQLVYLGAFRVPSSLIGWQYCRRGLAFNPDGDGGNGSLFGIGGPSVNYGITEISIPTPVISVDHDVSELNEATTIQDFVDVAADLGLNGLVPQDLEYIASDGWSSVPRLYVGTGRMFPDNTEPNHFVTDATPLSSSSSIGLWRIDDVPTVRTGYIMFQIPEEWADAHTGGRTLVSGRSRWGQGSNSNGPTLYAVSTPWTDTTTEITCVPILLYDNEPDSSSSVMGYNITDTEFWTGGAWVQIGEREALILGGQRSFGCTWYDHDIFSDHKIPVLFFYNPDDLAVVADGDTTYYPQPYAILNLDEYFFKGLENHNGMLAGIAYDPYRNLLYVKEDRVFGSSAKEYPIIHVFQIVEQSDAAEPKPESDSNPSESEIGLFSKDGMLEVSFKLTKRCHVSLKVIDASGRISKSPFDGWLGAGHHRLSFGKDGLPSGVYFVLLRMGKRAKVKKFVILN
ncbi:MAG: hypothetical protein DRQ10_03515 [Candidatus Hydrothermota bacterium]|nr:MAG: hypothetical protein DRQ10_03515 [Candidatus Hydrothermae bacterium]